MSQQRIPVNIITGFLGVGKTTAILHLLANRPAGEQWAVLVNEFGKVPIDRAAMQALGEEGMQIAEVAGGCLCCTAGVNTQLALQRLVSDVRPDRLLVEPTGLGHPDRIREIIHEGDFCEDLRAAASLCLVDPRQCVNPRIDNILSYWEQVRMADVIVINKVDLADAETVSSCRDKLVREYGRTAAIIEARQGNIPVSCLERPAIIKFSVDPPKRHHASAGYGEDIPVHVSRNGRVKRFESRGLDNFACGWVFAKDMRFSFDKLSALLGGILQPEHRIKGLFFTDRGWWLVNAVGLESTWDTAPDSEDSRLEVIQPSDPGAWAPLEERLLECLG